MDMGPHMKMTALRPPKPGDAARAQQVAEDARKASEKYTDYHAALADGFKIFHPEDSAEDVSLHQLRIRHGSGLQFQSRASHVAALRKARRRLQADRRDVHRAQALHRRSTRRAHPAQRGAVARACEFLRPSGWTSAKKCWRRIRSSACEGSITTQEACDAAGGTFHPVIFNWMVHVYPFEKDQASIWSVERQHGDAD